MIPVEALVDKEQAQRLRGHWITTLEDLAGALTADERGVGLLLEMHRSALGALRERVMGRLPAEAREAIEREAQAEHPCGALIPDGWDPSA